MSDLYSIPANAVGAIWVFQIDLAEPELAEFTDQITSANGEVNIWPLRDALGVAHLNADYTEVFQAETMKEYGLARYLTEANGMDLDSVSPDAAKLDALNGSLLLLFSSALLETELNLNPINPLQLVGRYTESRDFSVRQAPTSDAAQIETSVPVKKRPSDAAMSGRIATIALLLMGLFVWFLIWIS